MIIIVVDADNIQSQRESELQLALKTIRSNHLDVNDQEISDRSAGGLAIRNFETWLLIDSQTISQVLGVELEKLSDLENLENTKEILENAIAKSTYLAENITNQRQFQIRWDLAFQIDLDIIKISCPRGYGAFTQSLITVTKVVVAMPISP
jgi:hypothetical protein